MNLVAIGLLFFFYFAHETYQWECEEVYFTEGIETVDNDAIFKPMNYHKIKNLYHIQPNTEENICLPTNYQTGYCGEMYFTNFLMFNDLQKHVLSLISFTKDRTSGWRVHVIVQREYQFGTAVRNEEKKELHIYSMQFVQLYILSLEDGFIKKETLVEDTTMYTNSLNKLNMKYAVSKYDVMGELTVVATCNINENSLTPDWDLYGGWITMSPNSEKNYHWRQLVGKILKKHRFDKFIEIMAY